MVLIVAAAAIYYRKELLDALRKVCLKWVFFGLACYAVNYGFRAARFRSLSQSRLKIWPEGLHAACLHGFATYMMPFRSGELTLPIILRSVSPLSLREGSQILVQARFLDIQTLGGWIIAVALGFEIGLSRTMHLLWFAIGVAMLVLPAVIRRMGAKSGRSRGKLLDWFGRFIAEKPINWLTVIFSVAIWGAMAGCYFCAAQAIGLSLGIMQVWVLITMQLPLQLIPVQGVANAGSHEGGWIAALLMLGVSSKSALEFALLSHAIILLYVLALGPAALLTGYLCSPSQPD